MTTKIIWPLPKFHFNINQVKKGQTTAESRSTDNYDTNWVPVLCDFWQRTQVYCLRFYNCQDYITHFEPNEQPGVPRKTT